MVLLSSFSDIYQGVSYEDERKYGDGDISEGSLVFSCSKDRKAGWRTTTFIIHKPNF
jgi:hypothetical protein